MQSAKKQPLKVLKNNGGPQTCGAFDQCQPRFRSLEETLARVELLVRTLYRDSGGDPDAVLEEGH